jgi:AcrR family transcriptional regulator
MAGGQPGRGRPPRNVDQRERVIARAAELFARDGFENVGLGQIAEAVGISKAGLYHYFRAKREILDEIILMTLDGLIEAVGSAVEAETAPRDRFVAFLTAHASYFEANYWAFTAMLVGFGGLWPPSARDAAVERRDHYEGMLREIVAAGIRSGDFRRVDVPTASRAALSMLNWMSRWYDPTGRVRAATVAEGYAELLLDGLGAPFSVPGRRAPRRTSRSTRPPAPSGSTNSTASRINP